MECIFGVDGSIALIPFMEDETKTGSALYEIICCNAGNYGQ